MPDPMIRVRDVMHNQVETVDGMASVRAALTLMSAKNLSALIIERRHDGDEYGVVSIDKIAARVLAQNRSLDRTSVYEIMDKPMLTVAPDMAVKYAIRLLTRFDQRRALVVADGRTAGMVTLRDMVICHLDTRG